MARRTLFVACSQANTFRIYNKQRELTWSETKRASNIAAHGLDFADAQSVFEGMTYTFEDDRCSYSEQRFVTLEFQFSCTYGERP